MYKNKIFLLVFSLFTFAQLTSSQNNTNSPYTRFGYGDISETNSGEQRAMGGVAIGSRSRFGINTVNPASYSVVDSMTFMFDLGSSALLSRFSDPTGGRTKMNANIEYLSMQFPITKWLGFSGGLLPYSFSGYDFYSVDTTFTEIQGFDSIVNVKSFNGLGGISQVYTGISANLFNHISLGVNAYYMFGNIENNRELRFSNSTAYSSTVQQNIINAGSFRFRYGVQFYNTFAKKHNVTLGLIYEQKKKLNGNFTQITYSALNDTTEADLSFNDFELPRMYGVGLNYIYDDKLTIGIDYSMQEWGNAKFFGKTDSLTNRSKIAIGAEYQPNAKGRKYSDKIRYRAGINMSDSYYKIDGITPPKNFGISFGMGLPVRNSKTMLNTTIEYGKIGAASSLREDYFKFTFNAVFSEYWFFKRKL